MSLAPLDPPEPCANGDRAYIETLYVEKHESVTDIARCSQYTTSEIRHLLERWGYLTPEKPVCELCEHNYDTLHATHLLTQHRTLVNQTLQETELEQPYEELVAQADMTHQPLTTTRRPEPTTPDDIPNPNPSNPPECQCGQTVSESYVRVFSPDMENEKLQHCWACKPRSERY